MASIFLCGFREQEAITIKRPKAALCVGEVLTYKIAWLGVPVGTCVSRVKGIDTIDGKEAYVVELKADTNNVLSKLYPVHDTYTSYIDKERFVTLKHVVSRREGRYKKDAVTIFDYKSNKAFFHNSLDNSRKTFSIPGYVQDSLSAVYYFRALELKVGSRIEYTVVNNESLYDIIGIVERTSRIKLMGSEREVFYLRPYAKLEGNVVKKGKVSCWFSCDSSRLPLYGIIRAPIFTKVTAVLVDKKGG